MPSRPARAACALACALALALFASPIRAQSLHGSPKSIDRMYRAARADGLSFYRTPRAVRAARREGRLVRLTPGAHVALKSVSFPVVTEATRTFVRRLGARYHAACGERLVVTSATRPVSRQPANSVAKSVHPTGMAVDLHKPAGACLRWLRSALLDLERARVLEVTEEFAPPHLHVAVYPTAYTHYVDARSGRSSSTSLSLTASSASGASTGAYRVRPGDSLWSIARAHDTSVARLRALNGLHGTLLQPGQTLVVPTR